MRVLSLFLAILLFSSSAFSQPSIYDVVTIKKEIKELKEKYKRDLVTGKEYEEILTLLEKRLAVATEYQKKREEKSYAQ